MLLLEIAFWLILSYVGMSFIEYVLHRWPMHSTGFARRFPFLKDERDRHAWLHHGVYYPPHRFIGCPDPAGRYISVDLSPFFNLLGLAPLWGPVAWLHPAAGLTFAAFAFAHAVCWTLIHREMHEPKDRWFGRTRLFRLWRDYHETHHQRPSHNFNVVCPLFDHIFGTYLPPQRGEVM